MSRAYPGAGKKFTGSKVGTGSHPEGGIGKSKDGFDMEVLRQCSKFDNMSKHTAYRSRIKRDKIREELKGKPDSSKITLPHVQWMDDTAYMDEDR